MKGVYILRHTAAKRLLTNRVPITIVQSFLGHASIQTTAVYANPTQEMVRKELSEMSE